MGLVEQARAMESPMRARQLDNLTDLPTADDPRPTFFMSAVPPRNAGNLMRTTEFPKLMWCIEDNVEVTVHSEDEQRRMLAGGYTLTPQIIIPVSPMDALRAELEALSPEDRKTVIEAQRNDRIKALTAKMAALTDGALDSLLGGVKPVEPVKTGPVRPMKGV